MQVLCRRPAALNGHDRATDLRTVPMTATLYPTSRPDLASTLRATRSPRAPGCRTSARVVTSSRGRLAAARRACSGRGHLGCHLYGGRRCSRRAAAGRPCGVALRSGFGPPDYGHPIGPPDARTDAQARIRPRRDCRDPGFCCRAGPDLYQCPDVRLLDQSAGRHRPDRRLAGLPGAARPDHLCGRRAGGNGCHGAEPAPDRARTWRTTDHGLRCCLGSARVLLSRWSTPGLPGWRGFRR